MELMLVLIVIASLLYAGYVYWQTVVRLRKLEDDYQLLEDEYEVLNQENEELIEENRDMKFHLEQGIGMMNSIHAAMIGREVEDE